MASEEIRVLVVDDSAVIRSLIADSIAATPGMKVVGTAEDGRQALEMLDSARPDVITLDIQMPNMDGLATLDAILARRSDTGDHGQFADQVGGRNHAGCPRPGGR